MIAERLGCSETELIQRADRHTHTAHLWLAAQSPDLAEYRSPHTQAVSTGDKVESLNIAQSARYPADSSDIDREIEAVTQLFKARRVPAYWRFCPVVTPVKDFGHRLERHGWHVHRPTVPAMIADAQAFVSLPVSDTTRVWCVTTRNDLKIASRIRSLAFGFPAGVAVDYLERKPESWLENPDVSVYLAADGDEAPTAIGMMLTVEGIPGIYMIATLPDQRRRGLGKAVMNAIMNQAKAAGHHMIVLTSSTVGYGLYQQCGFEHVYDYCMYRLEGS